VFGSDPAVPVNRSGADCGIGPPVGRLRQFTSISPWIARRGVIPTEGPRRDEIGVFATLISRFGLGLVPVVEEALRQNGEGPLLDLSDGLESSGWCERAVNEAVTWAIRDLWSELRSFTR